MNGDMTRLVVGRDWFQRTQRRAISTTAAVVAALGLAINLPSSASALITGGEGNEPVTDRGWPAGAAAIFNHPGRIAWWEGPPFGGGQWHAECRGDAEAFNAVLASFAKLEVKTKRLVVRDGAGHSFWLNPNQEAEKKPAAQIDWRLMVWQAENWERLRQMPTDLNPIGRSDDDEGPPAQIDLYVGGQIEWDEVVVPEGVELVDERLEAHGFTVADGTVLEGVATDEANHKPVAARVRLELIEPQTEGGYRYTAVAEAAADDQGRWSLVKAPAGWHRVVVEADGYVPRVVGYGKFDEQPAWQAYNAALARPATVSGQVTDDAGQPLAEVNVRLGDVATEGGGHYESPAGYETTTDAEGRFEFDAAPVGKATVWVHKSGYVRPGLGPAIGIPAKDLQFQMTPSTLLRVTVDFAASARLRPADYMVNIEPKGGSKVGSWGGSGSIDADNQITFDDVPPGRYVLVGHPNPSSEDQRTEPLEIELKGGAVQAVTLPAK